MGSEFGVLPAGRTIGCIEVELRMCLAESVEAYCYMT
jgi:hypothetical protein